MNSRKAFCQCCYSNDEKVERDLVDLLTVRCLVILDDSTPALGGCARTFAYENVSNMD